MHVYEMEMQPDGTYVCNTFIGAGLESLLGPVPGGRTPEQAWEEAVHARRPIGVRAPPTKRSFTAQACESRRLIGFDGGHLGLGPLHPRETEDGRVLVDGVVVDVTEREQATEALADAQRAAPAHRLATR